MLLLEPGHTAYDLRFRVFGIPVRVHPMFWLFTAILGFSALNEENGTAKFAIWIVCVFSSILLHELGHALTGKIFGNDGHIVLYAFGGVAVHRRQFHHRWQRIVVLFAGPGIQLALVGCMLVGLACMGEERLEAGINLILALLGIPSQGPISLGLHPLLQRAIFDLFFINMFWALINLLPIYPLDGGQISKESLDAAMPGGQGERVAYGISMVIAALLTIHCIASANHVKFIPFLPAFGGIFAALLFGSLAVESWQLLQQHRHPPWRRED
jgi:Zn-dependent protease